MLRAALDVARRALPKYSHRFSPKKFTQHQLFACLVLKEFLQLDYRGLEALLAENASLRDVLGLATAPDYSTVARASRRLLLSSRVQRLLDQTLRRARVLRKLKRVQLAAIDCSGFEAHRVSHYFVRRRARDGKTTGKWHTTTYRRFPKIALVCDCHSHLILSATTHQGPAPDFDCWDATVDQARRRLRINKLLADAGFDAEWIHQAARIVYGMRTLIPAKHGRPTDKPPRGYFRRRMARRFDRKTYRQRAQVETVFSMLKRRLGSAVNAHHYWSQCRALLLKAITHNLMILRPPTGFQQSPLVAVLKSGASAAGKRLLSSWSKTLSSTNSVSGEGLCCGLLARVCRPAAHRLVVKTLRREPPGGVLLPGSRCRRARRAPCEGTMPRMDAHAAWRW
ncbi:MAG: transposase [Planctomycetes bacterium]|nr:transposase [Planctomycetota bacterium]